MVSQLQHADNEYDNIIKWEHSLCIQCFQCSVQKENMHKGNICHMEDAFHMEEKKKQIKKK